MHLGAGAESFFPKSFLWDSGFFGAYIEGQTTRETETETEYNKEETGFVFQLPRIAKEPSCVSRAENGHDIMRI